MSVEIVTFGCRLNLNESDAVRHHAQAAGLSNLTIVNTCAVTGEAVAQARQTIRRKFRERGHPVVVTGCAAQTDPHMFAAMPEVGRVIGNHDKLQQETWANFRENALDSAAEKIAVSDVMTLRDRDIGPLEGHEDRTRAFLQIQTGCDHRCTFCIIPFGRGNSRSLTSADIVTHARELVEQDYREIVLTGVDLTSYGEHLAGGQSLGAVVKQILAAVPGLARLRLSSIDAAEVDDDLVDAFANEPRLMPHLHLSLQAGDDMILKRMKRRHSRADATAFCARMRSLRPDIVFGADIIAGFPTETDDMFQRSLDLVEDCGLTHLHVFPFSHRPGTPAARMPQVRGDVIRQRARQLRERGEAALRVHLDAQVGSTRRVLTERGNSGRTEQFSQVRFDMPVEPGNIFDVAISHHDGRMLTASPNARNGAEGDADRIHGSQFDMHPEGPHHPVGEEPELGHQTRRPVQERTIRSGLSQI